MPRQSWCNTLYYNPLQYEREILFCLWDMTCWSLVQTKANVHQNTTKSNLKTTKIISFQILFIQYYLKSTLESKYIMFVNLWKNFEKKSFNFCKKWPVLVAWCAGASTKFFWVHASREFTCENFDPLTCYKAPENTLRLVSDTFKQYGCHHVSKIVNFERCLVVWLLWMEQWQRKKHSWNSTFEVNLRQKCLCKWC